MHRGGYMLVFGSMLPSCDNNESYHTREGSFSLLRERELGSQNSPSPTTEASRAPKRTTLREQKAGKRSSILRDLLHHWCCCIGSFLLDAAIGIIFEKLQSWRIFGNSFETEIAAEAQYAYFWQTMHALLNACDSKSLGTAYKQGAFAWRLVTGDCDNLMVRWNKEVWWRPLSCCKNDRKWDKGQSVFWNVCGMYWSF